MYPTREQTEKIVYCLNGDCEACSVIEWCEGEETTNCGKAMLAMHDVLDAKQAELDKAHDLIRRMAKWYMSTEDTSDGIEYSDYTGLLDEAEALLNEKQA